MTSAIIYTDIVKYSAKKNDQAEGIKDSLDRKVPYFFPEQILVREKEQALYMNNTGDGFLLTIPLKNISNPRALILLFTLYIAHKARTYQHKIRASLHTGEVNRYVDFMNQEQRRGAAIVEGRRILDLGGDGHILCSERFKSELVGELGQGEEAGENEELFRLSGSLDLKTLNLPIHIIHDATVLAIWESSLTFKKAGNYNDKHGNVIKPYNIYLEKSNLLNDDIYRKDRDHMEQQAAVNHELSESTGRRPATIGLKDRPERIIKFKLRESEEDRENARQVFIDKLKRAKTVFMTGVTLQKVLEWLHGASDEYKFDALSICPLCYEKLGEVEDQHKEDVEMRRNAWLESMEMAIEVLKEYNVEKTRIRFSFLTRFFAYNVVFLNYTENRTRGDEIRLMFALDGDFADKPLIECSRDDGLFKEIETYFKKYIDDLDAFTDGEDLRKYVRKLDVQKSNQEALPRNQ